MSRIEIKQHDLTDCGAACLSSIFAYYNLMHPLSKIRQVASTDTKGTNIMGLVTAAEKFGFSAKGVKSLNNDGSKNLVPLPKIPFPAIAHVVINNKLLHYIVIYKITKTYVQVMDPAIGKLEKWELSKFEGLWTGILVLIVPNEGTFKKGNEIVSITKRLLYLLKPHTFVVLQSIFGALVYTALGLATSIYVQKIIDYVLPNSNSNLLNLMGIIMLTILIINTIINYLKSLFILRTGQKIDARLILGYYKYLIKLPQSFFDNMRTGEVISRIGDAIKIRTFINNTFISLIVSIFTVVFAFVLMFTYYWKLALIIFIAIPLYAVLYYIYNKVNKKTQRKVMEDAAELESHLVESLNSIRTIKSFGIEDFANFKTESRFIRLLNTSYKSGVNALSSSIAARSVSQLFTIILLWCGASYVVENQITAGELLSFYALIAYFIGPVAEIIGMNMSIQDARIASERLFDIMDLQKESNENKVQLSLSNIGDITFENVSFSYGTRADIFENLNLKVSKGTMTAIVGESGSGKSTIASLLQNLYPISKGHIKIGELDLKHIDINSLRDVISVVPQKLDLFDGSVIENIALGDYAPDMERILSISKSIGIIEFIEKMPNGFATNIGENGVKLSGGQRQRLAIARALYRNPEIIILDEATSALDSQSEAHIKNVINHLKMQGKTIIVIAHRLGTITNADKVIVLKDGVVVEEGSHKNLIEKNGAYKNLIDSQL